MDVVGEVRSEAGGEGIEIVVLEGEHDLGTLPQVREAFETTAGEEKALIIDLLVSDFRRLVNSRRRAGCTACRR